MKTIKYFAQCTAITAALVFIAETFVFCVVSFANLLTTLA
jgi:hypothetical protein